MRSASERVGNWQTPTQSRVARTVTGDTSSDGRIPATFAIADLTADWRPISERLDTRWPGSWPSTLGDLSLFLDATPPGSGRDVIRLRDLAIATGTPCIAVTGAHAPPGRLPRIETRSAEFLAEWFATEICMGVLPVLGDCIRGEPLLSDAVIGRANDVLIIEAIRAGAIRISFANPTLDRDDRKLVDASAIAAGANGVAVIVDAAPDFSPIELRSCFVQAGGDPSRLILAPRNHAPDALGRAADAGMAVIVASPVTGSKPAMAIWEGTIVGLLRAGHVARTIVSKNMCTARTDTGRGPETRTPSPNATIWSEEVRSAIHSEPDHIGDLQAPAHSDDSRDHFVRTGRSELVVSECQGVSDADWLRISSHNAWHVLRSQGEAT